MSLLGEVPVFQDGEHEVRVLVGDPLAGHDDLELPERRHGLGFVPDEEARQAREYLVEARAQFPVVHFQFFEKRLAHFRKGILADVGPRETRKVDEKHAFKIDLPRSRVQARHMRSQMGNEVSEGQQRLHLAVVADLLRLEFEELAHEELAGRHLTRQVARRREQGPAQQSVVAETLGRVLLVVEQLSIVDHPGLHKLLQLREQHVGQHDCDASRVLQKYFEPVELSPEFVVHFIRRRLLRGFGNFIDELDFKWAVVFVTIEVRDPEKGVQRALTA